MQRLRIHGAQTVVALGVETVEAFDERLAGHLLLREDVRETARLERFGVENLVSAAGSLGIRHQQRRLLQRENFAQGIRACARKHNVRRGEQIGQLFGDVLLLHIACLAGERRVEVALAADVRHIEARQQIVE